MTAPLSPRDREIIQALRGEAGVLCDIAGRRLNPAKGVIMVACADGDQMADVFERQAGICRDHSRDRLPRVHTLALNGGALLIPKGSPVINPDHPEDGVLLSHLQAGMRLKDIPTIVLYAHCPCGAASLASLAVESVIDLLMRAKERVKKEIDGAKVACFFHVDRGHGNKRTYFVSREKWLAWKEANMPSAA